MNPRFKNLLLAFLVCLLVVGVSAWEDWFGRYDYGDDSVSYLDISKAIDRGDWTVALNPYWSIGYPLVLSATRWMFPPGPQDEWAFLHVMNLVLFLGTYLSFLYFLRVATIFASVVSGAPSAAPKSGWNGFIFAIGTTIFLLFQVLTSNVSRLSPDPLISGAFFLVMAAGLNFLMRPSVKAAVIFGLLMGMGYLLKAIFLPVSAFVFLTMLVFCLTRAPAARLPMAFKLAWALPAMALLALPYMTALSKATGMLTFGETGKINYAWCVNDMPRSTDWQGGPAQFGAPIHPTHMVLTNPPVFTFAEPFPVTYPPWFNPPYWFQGYLHFFSLRNQIDALKTNEPIFRRFFIEGAYCVPKTIAIVLFVAGGLFLLKDRRIWWNRLLSLWPVYLPCFASIGIYLLVFVEPRYIVGFLILLFFTPFLCLFVPTQLISKKAAYTAVSLLVLYSAGCLVQDKMDIFKRAIHDQPYTSEEQWRVGLYLAASGVQPGEKIAVVGIGNRMNCTFAYVSGVHIVAEIGNDGYDEDNQEADLQLFTDHPEVQQTVFKLFQQAGADLVVGCYLNGPPQGPGWQGIPGTTWWFQRLSAEAP